MTIRLLLSGHDTIECAYYLAPKVAGECLLDYESLACIKEEMRLTKSRNPMPIQLGTEEFFLASHGTKSGFPFLIENEAFSIQFGEFNKPNFYVTYRSLALWHQGAMRMHQRFLAWALSVGLQPYMPERLSRVDFTFDYQLSELDFNEDNFVSFATKDNKHRKNGRTQTFRFGEGDLVLRVYDKCAEIQESSSKTWFYDLWQTDKDVWRIEWQARKKWLRPFGVITFDDLTERQGDLLRFISTDHTTLRCKSDDSNRSRWPLHPLWHDLTKHIETIDGLGVIRELDMAALLDERETRIAISIYGYMKRVAAIECMKNNEEKAYLDEAFFRIQTLVNELHDPLTWQNDVKKRVFEMRLGEW